MIKQCKIDLVNPYAFCKNEKDKIFIKKNNLNGANHEDIVEVEIFKEETENQLPEAKVIRIIKPHFRKHIGYVISKNLNSSYIKSSTLSQDVKYNKKLKLNTVVEFSIKVNSKNNKIYTDDLKIIGKFNDFKVKQYMKVFSSGLSFEYPKCKIDTKDDDIDIRKNIIDINHITIDGKDAKDLDDSIYLEKQNDKYILYVSIADVASYVKENTKLDEIAKKRGNSTYLIGKVIPMLPEKLSNNLCSLNPNEVKRAVTIKMTLNSKAKLETFDVFNSYIMSKKRYTYDLVNNIYDKLEENDQFKDMLFLMKELSDKLTNNYLKKGSISFQDLEIKFDDLTLSPSVRERSHAEKMIENFMILANETIGQYMYDLLIPTIYRVHESPNYEDLKEVMSDISVFDKSLSIPKTREIKSYDLQKILDMVKGKDYEYIVNKKLIRAMKKANYSTDSIGHFGLSLENYLHFTSPIRRYSDLIVHRYLKKIIRNETLNDNEKIIIKDKLEKISKHISETELNSFRLEQSVKKVASLFYYEKLLKKDPFVYGVISYIKNNKIYFEDEYSIELVMLNVDSKNFKLGNKYLLKVLKVNYEYEEIEVEIDLREQQKSTF